MDDFNFKRPLLVVERLSEFAFSHLILILTTTLFYYIFYQRYCHPLRHFPGPFFASLTSLWRIHAVLSGKQHLRDYALHCKYGPVFRDGPNSLSFSDPRALDPIYGHKTYLSKSDWYSIFAPDESGKDYSVFSSKGREQHKRLRRRIAGPYSLASAQMYEPSFDDNIMDWTQRLKDLGVVQFDKWAKYFTLDALSDVGLGQRFGCKANGIDINDYGAELYSSVAYATIIGFLPTVTRLTRSWLLKPLRPYFDLSLHAATPDESCYVGKIIGAVSSIIKDRQQNGNTVGKPHMVNSIVSLTEPDGSHLSQSELTVECMTTIIAGSDSTAYAIEATIYHVLQHPEVHAKLVSEIQATDAQGKLSLPVASYAEITAALPYLHAVITETMRLYPSFGGNFPRVLGDHGAEILPGIYVPRRTKVSVSAYVSHRDKAAFGEDAGEFRPERWLGPDKRRMEKLMSTFGYGARLCLGRHIALMEIYKTLCEIFRKFDVSLVNPEAPLKEINTTVMVVSDFDVRFAERCGCS